MRADGQTAGLPDLLAAVLTAAWVGGGIMGRHGSARVNALAGHKLAVFKGAPGGGRVCKMWPWPVRREGTGKGGQLYITNLLCKSGSEGSPEAQPLSCCKGCDAGP